MEYIQVLRDVDGLTFSQIGETLGISKDAAQKRYRRLSLAGQSTANAAAGTAPAVTAWISQPASVGQDPDVPAGGRDPSVHPTGWVGFSIAHFDLETTSLDASVGRLLCACIADNDGNVETFRITDYKGKSLIDDSRLAVAIRDRLEQFDIYSSWNGKLFDVPFLNGRLIQAGERPLIKKMHVDMMYMATGTFVRIGRRSLENVAKVLQLPVQKEGLDKYEWSLAIAGDKAALARIIEHCEADVLVLR